MNDCEKSSGFPSTENAAPPIIRRFSPVAETITSASTSVPSIIRMPLSVKVSISPVSIDASPRRIA